MPSKITIQFNSLPVDGQLLELKPGFGSNGLKETFKILRTAAFQSTIGATTAALRGEYFNAFTADYNTTSLFDIIDLDFDKLTIEHPDNGFFVIGNVVNTTSGAITIVSVDDTPDPTLINITDVSFSEAVNACQDVQLDITTDVVSTIVRVNGNVITVQYLGVDKAVNGNFETDTDWIKGDGWTISGGSANCDGSQVAVSILGQSGASFPSSTDFEITFTISNLVDGFILPVVGGTVGLLAASNGVHRRVITSSGASSFAFNASVDFTGSIDNVSIREVLTESTFFNFEQIRGAFINLEVENAEGETANQNIQVPQALSVSSTVVTVVNSPSGATVTTVVSNDDGLTLTYSLDDVVFQSSNSFSGITPGNYTSFIKDQLGCKIQLDFVVDDFDDEGIGVQFALADLPSKSNSIRFARIVDHENCSNYKNDENTLSCDLPFTQNPRQVNQLFQDCDVITTQIRSNYSTIIPTVIQEDGTETTIPINKKTTNIGVKDKRDAIKYGLGNQQAGIYFTSGNTYDFDTDVQNGTYVLNGGLPSFGFIGNYILLSTVWFQIVDIIFDESKNAEVLVINDNYIGGDVTVIVGSIFNLQEYEVYEFIIDMGDFPSQKIQVNITETDTRTDFPDIIFLSELIDIKERHADTVEIVYFSDINTDIFYSTGIINKIRIPIEYVEGGFEDDTEAEKTDINVYPVNAEIYETDTFHFQLLSKQLMRKVMQALAHKFVTIDEVGYVKESSPAMTALVGTNLYRLDAPMTKEENVYTSQGTGVELEVGEIEVPNLIQQTADGFIRWK